jgi:hypothetical protein
MKKFEELTIPMQKKRIVRDAIQQINIGLFIPKNGHYFSFVEGNWIVEDMTKDIQSALVEGHRCTCCAKGGLFAACVLNVDKVNFKHSFTSESFQKNKLKKWFTPLELDMIETAFEKRVITDSTGNLQDIKTLYSNPYTFLNSTRRYKTALANKCIAFGKQHKKASDRLLAILNNILVNKVFTP